MIELEIQAFIKELRARIMEDAWKRLKQYVKWLGIEVVREEKELLMLVVREKLPGSEERIEIEIIVLNEMWIRLQTLLIPGYIVNKYLAEGCNVFRHLMLLSYKTAEFNFACDEDCNIYIKADIYIPALTFDVFEEEYYAIPNAVVSFRDQILPKLERCEEITSLYT